MRYSSGGLAETLLSALEPEPASFAELADSLANERRRRKAYYVLRAARCDGLVERVGPERYDLTPEGRSALAQLRAGLDVVTDDATPNVRVFAYSPSGSAA